MSEHFKPALDFVIDALKSRRDAGATLKASVTSVIELQSTVRLQKAPNQLSGLSPKAESIPEKRNPAASVHAVTVERHPAKSGPPAQSVQPRSLVQTPADSPSTTPLKRLETSEKIVQLDALRKSVLACQMCPNLVASRTNVVYGVGNPDAELMLVGEAPGADEDIKGEPFVGAAGELLNKILTAMGISRQDVFIANVLKCRPDVPPGSLGNRKPAVEEMERCLPYLQKQISIVQPRVIVALGATAMQGLFGKTEPMARLRSNWYTTQGIPVMATYHPSYLLRNQALSEKRKVWEDLLQVLEKLGHPISEKQRGFFLRSSGS